MFGFGAILKFPLYHRLLGSPPAALAHGGAGYQKAELQNDRVQGGAFLPPVKSQAAMQKTFACIFPHNVGDCVMEFFCQWIVQNRALQATAQKTYFLVHPFVGVLPHATS